MARISQLAVAAALSLSCAAGPAEARTLEDVRSSGVVTCGLDPEKPGLSVRNGDFSWSGVAADLCRAIAVAVLGDPKRVNMVALAPEEQTIALQSGEIDVLLGGARWFQGLDSNDGLMAVGPYLHEGISLLTTDAGASPPENLSDATICFVADALPADWYQQQIERHKGKAAEVPSQDELKTIVAEEGCTHVAGPHFSLALLRSETVPQKMNLHEAYFGLTSFAPVVRQGDDQWFHLVREVEHVLIRAAEEGLTQEEANNGGTLSSSVAPLQAGGLQKNWPTTVIAATGNLQEMFDRNFGPGTSYGLAPGLNAPWNRGGLFTAPP